MLLLVVGIALVVFVFVDAVWTTLGLNRAGPLAGRLAGWTWKGLLALAGRDGRSRLLDFAGTVTLLVVIFGWVLVLWLGWSLIFLSDPNALVNAATQAPADTLSRVYFVGYTLVTLGLGDFVPQGGWKIVTVLCSVHGLFELTLAISYLLPVLGAATEGRQIAASVRGLGATPQAILTNAWTGDGFGALGQHLQALQQALALHTYAHFAYPVLHFSHSSKPQGAPPLQIAVLDEALTLLLCAVDEEARPDAPTLRSLRYATSTYLGTLEAVYVEVQPEPPLPDLGPLRTAGIPVCSDEELRTRLAAAGERRQALRGLVNHDGWTWDDVTSESDTDEHASLHALRA